MAARPRLRRTICVASWVTVASCVFFGLIVAEAYFLLPSLQALLRNAQWYRVPIREGGGSTGEQLVILLPPDHPGPQPIMSSMAGNYSNDGLRAFPLLFLWFAQSGADAGSNDDFAPQYSLTVSLDNDIPTCTWNNAIEGVDEEGSRTFIISDPTDNVPSAWFVGLALMGFAARWTLILSYGIAISISRVTKASRLAVVFRRLEKSMILFVFVYTCSVILSLCIVGTRVTDCIEWWAVGADGLHLFELQTTFWLTNLVGLITMTVFSGCFICGTRSRCCDSMTTDLKLCPPAVAFIIFLYFGFTAGLTSVIVMLVGIIKPWISCIWLSILLCVVERHIRGVWDTYALTRPGPAAYSRTLLGFAGRNHRGSAATTTSNKFYHDLACFAQWQLEEGKSKFFRFRSDAMTMELESGDSTSAIAEVRDVKKTVYGKATSGEGLCLICLDQEANTVLMPCCHRVTCDRCLQELLGYHRRSIFNTMYSSDPNRRERFREALADPVGSETLGCIHCPMCRAVAKEIYQIEVPSGTPLGESPSPGVSVKGNLMWRNDGLRVTHIQRRTGRSHRRPSPATVMAEEAPVSATSATSAISAISDVSEVV